MVSRLEHRCDYKEFAFAWEEVNVVATIRHNEDGSMEVHTDSGDPSHCSVKGAPVEFLRSLVSAIDELDT